MRIIVSESQFNKVCKKNPNKSVLVEKTKTLLKEQGQLFYYQPNDYMGRKDPKSDYVFSQGGPINKPQGAIDAKTLFPSGEPKSGYPKKLTVSQVQDLFKNKKPFEPPMSPNQFKKEINTNSIGSLKPAYPPPVDWQWEESAYEIFREPLGRPDKYVTGNYRGRRGLIPPQTNKYFWDPEEPGTMKQKVINSQGKTFDKTIQTKGGWVVKSLDNVDKWRNVPSGYHPSEYPQALEWMKRNFRQPQGELARDAESTAINKSKILPYAQGNPFYQKKYPLGLTMDMVAYKDSLKNQNNERYKYKELKAPQGSDTIWEITKGNREKIRWMLHQQQMEANKKIEDSFGYYQKQIEQEDDEFPMWFKVLQFSLYLIPYTAPYASEINGLIELVRAAKHLEEGQPGKAAAEAFFGILPFTGLKGLLQNANAMNALKHIAQRRALTKAEEVALKELSKMSDYHPAKVVSEINMGIEKIINQVLPKALHTGAKEVSKNFSKKMVSDFEKEVGAYGALKYASTFLY